MLLAIGHKQLAVTKLQLNPQMVLVMWRSALRKIRTVSSRFPEISKLHEVYRIVLWSVFTAFIQSPVLFCGHVGTLDQAERHSCMSVTCFCTSSHLPDFMAFPGLKAFIVS
ncbi:hypothetical protein AMECASPLE_000872 [Ameca splendens]|uniref:Uncharacterized protein n=1 Tax=Ameca splendens TaxID=208324 RepID=A0ABV0XBB2_9TELE